MSKPPPKFCVIRNDKDATVLEDPPFASLNTPVGKWVREAVDDIFSTTKPLIDKCRELIDNFQPTMLYLGTETINLDPLTVVPAKTKPTTQELARFEEESRIETTFSG